jgi:hypothetical protein
MSIYHFRENNPSQAEQRLAASHRFAEQINKSMEPHQKFKFDQKAKEADRAQKQAFADQIMNDPSLAGLDIQTRRLLANEAAGLTSAQSTKSLINAMRDREANESFNAALRGDGEESNNAPNMNMQAPNEQMPNENEELPPEKPRRNYDSELNKWQKILRNPKAENQKFAQAKIDEIHRQRDLEHKLEERNYKRNEAFLKDVDSSAKNIHTMGLALKQMRSSLDQGDYSSFQNIAANITGQEWIKTASAQVANTATKEYLMSSLSELTGRPNQFIEQQLTKAAINPEYTEQANRAILEGLDLLYDLRRKKVEFTNQMEEHYTRNGGEVPRNFIKLVNDKLDKYATPQLEKYEKNVKNILNRKKTPKNGKPQKSLKEIFG